MLGTPTPGVPTDAEETAKRTYWTKFQRNISAVWNKDRSS